MLLGESWSNSKFHSNMCYQEGPVKGGDQAPTVDQMKSLDAALLASVSKYEYYINVPRCMRISNMSKCFTVIKHIHLQGEDLSGNSITISKLDANSEADAESSTVSVESAIIFLYVFYF